MIFKNIKITLYLIVVTTALLSSCGGGGGNSGSMTGSENSGFAGASNMLSSPNWSLPEVIEIPLSDFPDRGRFKYEKSAIGDEIFTWALESEIFAVTRDSSGNISNTIEVGTQNVYADQAVAIDTEGNAIVSWHNEVEGQDILFVKHFVKDSGWSDDYSVEVCGEIRQSIQATSLDAGSFHIAYASSCVAGRSPSLFIAEFNSNSGLTINEDLGLLDSAFELKPYINSSALIYSTGSLGNDFVKAGFYSSELGWQGFENILELSNSFLTVMSDISPSGEILFIVGDKNVFNGAYSDIRYIPSEGWQDPVFILENRTSGGDLYFVDINDDSEAAFGWEAGARTEEGSSRVVEQFMGLRRFTPTEEWQELQNVSLSPALGPTAWTRASYFTPDQNGVVLVGGRDLYALEYDREATIVSENKLIEDTTGVEFVLRYASTNGPTLAWRQYVRNSDDASQSVLRLWTSRYAGADQ